MEDPHEPRRKGAKRTVHQPKAPSPSGRLHVLVVEDDVTMRESLEAYFSLLGHRARLAADAASAIEAARHARFDALLCDLGLPDGNGCELLRHLDQTGRRPPVVVSMSVSDGLEAGARSQAAGFQGHLRKPFTPQQLSQQLEAALAQVAGKPCP